MSNTALDATPELKEAMQAFAGISESLVRSYQALDERARLVEEELGRTNAELARKVSELALVNGHLEAVLRSLPTGVVVRDAAHRIVRANAAAIALLEAGPLPVSGDREEIVELTGRDGVRRTVATRRSALRDARGAAAGSVEILDDRTELATMTERVHALDKMAALGTLGGGIAHEIRNPLNAVKGFAELLERSLAGGDPQPARWAHCIVEGAAEADAIIESLLAFASPERLKQEALDGAELLRDAARAALGDEPRHALSLRSDAPPFLGDRIKLRQALRNLIANAAQAQPDGGSIEVELERSGGELLFRVRDAGPGIPRALRAKVQDPFFTTRPEGTGLGLALVSTIARLHAGRVDIGSAPPRLGGAEITLRIPFHPVQPHGPSEEKRTF